MAVTSIDINERGPYAGGMTFGDIGAYEQLDGTVHFAVDPASPANSLITDLELAPRNQAGLVEFSADFRILKPVDLQKGSHKLFFDVVKGRESGYRDWLHYYDVPKNATAKATT